jgi:hypothetical protein
MGRFIEGADRPQSTLLTEAIDDYVGEGNPPRIGGTDVRTVDPRHRICRILGHADKRPAIVLAGRKRKPLLTSSA